MALYRYVGGDVAMGATLTKKWVGKSLRDAVLKPFFEAYELHKGFSSTVGLEIDSISLSSDGAPPVVLTPGDDLERALAAPHGRT